MSEQQTPINRCNFAYRCPKTWEALYETNIESIRFCDQCEKNVFLSRSADEALARGAKGECIAIPIELTDQAKEEMDLRSMIVGLIGPPPPKKENIEDLYVRELDRVVEFYGIDGCPAGWLFVGVDLKGECQFGVLERFSDVGILLGQSRLILVDIPIGLVSSGDAGRVCDTAARKVIAPRASSVFSAPARPAIAEHAYREGSDANFRAVGKKLSTQSWAIVPKIREVDDYMRSARVQEKVREMHPEVAFWALNNRKALKHGKKKPEGAEERLEILTEYLPHARETYESALDTYKRKDVAADDILDAMVGAVTAMHHPRITTLPANPAKDDEGLVMEMVYAVVD